MTGVGEWTPSSRKSVSSLIPHPRLPLVKDAPKKGKGKAPKAIKGKGDTEEEKAVREGLAKAFAKTKIDGAPSGDGAPPGGECKTQ